MKTLTLPSIAIFVFATSGCSITGGRFQDETHFSFPNSNVEPLGQVKSTLSRWSFFTQPVASDDALTLLDDALAQKSGADLVINYTLDTTITAFPLFLYKADMVLEGTAVKMQVGEQRLRSVLDQVRYRPAQK